MKEAPENLELFKVILSSIAEGVYFIYEAQLFKHKYERYLFSSDDVDADETTEE